ncbi:hypothetical protein CSPX01_06013 [Colletotrichum filicis]|nr:hypothetical protein CSPX01_06013 [Colletotrichum filicis]
MDLNTPRTCPDHAVACILAGTPILSFLPILMQRRAAQPT